MDILRFVNSEDIREYLRKTGYMRTLTALSNYYKGKIDLELLMQAYRTICLEERAKEMRPKQYTDEGMLLAGLKERTEN